MKLKTCHLIFEMKVKY